MSRATLVFRVFRALLMQARVFGDTSFRYEELGGGWVPGPEGAEVVSTPL